MAIEKTITINAETDKAEKSINNLVDALKETTDALKEVGNSSKKELQDVEKEAKKTEKSTSKLSNGFKSVTKAVGGLSAGFKALGIGLIIGAFVKLTEAFQKNERIANAVSDVMNGISVVFTQVTNAVIKAYDSVSGINGGFDALKKVISSVIDIALAPLRLTFESLKLSVLSVQKAWENSLFGEKDPKTIKELNKSIEETKDNIIKLGGDVIENGKTIGKNFKEAVGEVTDFTTKTIDNISKVSIKGALETGKALTQARNNSRLAEVGIQGLIEKYDVLAEQQRQIRDDERLTLDEREKANERLGEILKQQLDEQLNLANQRVKSAQLEIEATGNNIDNQVALKEAMNEVVAVQAQVTGFASEQLINEEALQRERIENLNEIAQINKDEFELKKIEAEQKLEADKLLIEKTITDEVEKNNALLEAKREYDSELEAIEDERLERVKELQDKEDAIKRKSEEEEKARAKEKANFKETLERNVFGALQSLAKKGSALGKAIAIADATISTSKGVIKALSETTDFTPTQTLRFANAAAVGVAGAVNIAKIVSTPDPTSGSVGAVGSGGGASTPPPPSFNLVEGTGTNQIAESLQQEQRPIKAFVVSSEVTTKQALDRNIEETASF